MKPLTNYDTVASFTPSPNLSLSAPVCYFFCLSTFQLLFPLKLRGSTWSSVPVCQTLTPSCYLALPCVPAGRRWRGVALTLVVFRPTPRDQGHHCRSLLTLTSSEARQCGSRVSVDLMLLMWWWWWWWGFFMQSCFVHLSSPTTIFLLLKRFKVILTLISVQCCTLMKYCLFIYFLCVCMYVCMYLNIYFLCVCIYMYVPEHFP